MSYYEQEVACLNDTVHRLQIELSRARRERDELAMFLAGTKRRLAEAENQLIVATRYNDKIPSFRSSKAKRTLTKVKRKLAITKVL
ncbi:hypothetical protein [Halomonas sp. PR-M31]|uniref:hypothetical protein n=1 Tax=Halomonas sp. PR-M31 TaxID=1471202 RepID=UPI0006518FF4|nr:hypothetical protein [Halomonas sp. PR-M31]